MARVVRISKTYRFDAAHRLPDHDGKCRREHGHTYALTLTLEGKPLDEKGNPKDGMVVDYGVLDQVWRYTLEPLLDHQDLNLTLRGALGRRPTTAENIATVIAELLRTGASKHLPWSEVTVSETPSTSATVSV